MTSFRRRNWRERFWEVIPGTMFWSTLVLAVIFSHFHPVWVSVFIILFDLYWMFKAVNTAAHLMSAYYRYKYFVTLNWLDRLRQLADLPAYSQFLEAQQISAKKGTAQRYYKEEISKIQTWLDKGTASKTFDDIYHIVLYPFVDEPLEVLNTTMDSLVHINYPKDHIIVLLASEERVGQKAQHVAHALEQKYGQEFFKFFITIHPDGLAGEIRGKSANTSWAVQSILPELKKLGIPIEKVIVSNFDSDTIVHSEYLARVTYEFLLAEKPYRQSYQPIAMYNNNIWDSPSFVRVVSISNTFFQFLECSRPNRLRTFSSHSMTLKALVEVGFWRKDMINEDGYIFWQCYMHYDGDYTSKPLFVPISLDTCLADTTWKTLINQYKQKRRWSYNVEYYPALVPGLLKCKANFWDKMYKLWQYVEGNYNLATASIILGVLGWLPLYIGADRFGDTVVASNLPLLTRILMTIATSLLAFSIYINMVILPPRPAKYSRWKTVSMYLQWIIAPLVTIIFGSLPAIESQTRLMLGFYMEFWVTPKVRKTSEQELIDGDQVIFKTEQ